MAAFLRRTARWMNKSNAEVWIAPASSTWRATFKDVSGDTAHGEDIMWLAHSAVSTGYDDGTFRGMTDVYRQDMAAFLHRVFDLGEAKYDNPNSDHVHDWSIGVGSNSRGGIACNGCARDVTDWDDPMSCCGGWHTHTWITEPGGSMCSMCGLKRHLHTWRYVEPAYYSGTDEIMRPGYWGCSCGAESSDGSTVLPIEITYNGFKRGAIDKWETPYDFDADGAGKWILLDSYWEEPSGDVQIQSIAIQGDCSLSPGDIADLSVAFTPATAGAGKAVIWSSDNPSVVSVDGRGALVAHKEGAATITAECEGRKTSKFIRVTSPNIGVVANAVLLVDGKHEEDKPIVLGGSGANYAVTLKTDPQYAVYTVDYSFKDKELSDGYPLYYDTVWISGSSSCGNRSSYSWEHGPTFTDPATEIETGRTGTATLVAKIIDMNGNVMTLEQDVVIE